MSDELKDARRVYYDHEPAYRKIAAAGGEGWDDMDRLQPDGLRDEEFGSYDSFMAFLESDAAPTPCRALELGCGGGQASLMLARRGFEVVGVDFSETAVELARRNARQRSLSATFQRGDVTDLSELGDQSFGFVVDNHCLHCLVDLSDRANALAEVRRLLVDDGLFFIETMSAEGHYTPAEMGVDPETGIDAHHVRRWVTEAHLRDELDAAGLDVLDLSRVPQEPHTGDCIVVVASRR